LASLDKQKTFGFVMSLPLAAPTDFTSNLYPPHQKEGLWFIFSKDMLLISEDAHVPCHHNFPLQRSIYLGTLRDTHVFAGEIAEENNIPCGWKWAHLKSLYVTLNEEMFAIAGRALQLIHWDRTSQFCGHCGNPTIHRQHERCRECTLCKQLFYPKLSPVAMAIVQKGDKILLARSSHFPGKSSLKFFLKNIEAIS
jgi:NAD+ diphosphatase